MRSRRIWLFGAVALGASYVLAMVRVSPEANAAHPVESSDKDRVMGCLAAPSMFSMSAFLS